MHKDRVQWSAAGEARGQSHDKILFITELNQHCQFQLKELQNGNVEMFLLLPTVCTVSTKLYILPGCDNETNDGLLGVHVELSSASHDLSCPVAMAQIS